MSSVKNRLSRKVKATFVKTEQKLRLSRTPTNESEIHSLEQFKVHVKKQKSLVRELAGQWKNYLTHAQEAEKPTVKFESALLQSFSSKEETRDNIERSLMFFPDSSTCDLEKELKEVKNRLEEASKRIKDAEVIKRNYLANKNMHEKANVQEKEQEKRVMEESRRKLSDFVKELDQCIPQMLAKNDEELYKYMLKYFTSKCEYLNSTLSETKKILNQIKFARESDPAPSKYPRVSPLSPNSPPGPQAPSNGSTADDNAYTQPLNPLPKSATDDHRDEGTAASTHPTVSNSDSRHNGLGTSTHDQANGELASRTPPFDVIAAFAYTSEEQDELDFKVDERITVLPWENSEDEKKSTEPGWLYGKHHGSGLKGLFPANYVTLA